MTPPSIASDRSPTPPEELPEGTLWIAPDGHLYTFGTRPWVGADGDEWIGADGAEWLGSGYIDAQDQLIVTTAEAARSEEHTSELQSLMRISYAVFCLKKKNNNHN